MFPILFHHWSLRKCQKDYEFRRAFQVKFQASRLGQSVMVVLGDRLIVGNSGALLRQLLSEIEGGTTSVTIDFSNTKSVDSSGLETLVYLSKKIHDRKGEVTLLNFDSGLRSLMELTELDTLFMFEGR
ncbi:MAG TPA: anti-sigma factor antagonist [Gemmatimonadetes bacterium]|nr:anti-sigma factor antagonist [Gemmatimonadota bacterium]